MTHETRKTAGLAVGLLLAAGATQASTDCQPGQKGMFGGDGSSVEQAVLVCGAASEEEGVQAERDYLEQKYPRFDLEGQHLLMPPGRAYDQMDIVLPDGSKRSVYFDITAFFGIDFR